MAWAAPAAWTAHAAPDSRPVGSRFVAGSELPAHSCPEGSLAKFAVLPAAPSDSADSVQTPVGALPRAEWDSTAGWATAMAFARRQTRSTHLEPRKARAAESFCEHRR